MATKTRLTRNDMAELLKAGQSVIHGGRVISRVEHLPAEEDLVTDKAGADALRDQLMDQMAETRRRLAALESRPAPADSPAADDPRGVFPAVEPNNPAHTATPAPGQLPDPAAVKALHDAPAADATPAPAAPAPGPGPVKGEQPKPADPKSAKRDQVLDQGAK